MIDVLSKLDDIFKHSNIKKDYYYIFVKRDIDNTWSHYVYIKRPIDTSKLMLDEQRIYDYQNIYVVETKHNTLDIISVKIYDTRKDTTTPLLNKEDIRIGILPDLIKQIQAFLGK